MKYNENLYKLVPGSLGAEGRGEFVSLLGILNDTERYLYIYPKRNGPYHVYLPAESFVPAHFSVMPVKYVQYSREGKGVWQSIYNGK